MNDHTDWLFNFNRSDTWWTRTFLRLASRLLYADRSARARADVLAKEFAHYGVKLNLHALRDPHRRLLPTARHVSRGNTGVVMSQLTHALDDLELALVERG